MIKPTQRFIALDRNPDIEPASWPFRRAQRTEAGTDETPQAAQPEGREPGPKDAPKSQSETQDDY